MPSIPRRANWRTSVARVAACLAALYVLLCGAGCALQRRLIYFPTKLTPQLAENLAAREGFQPWKNQRGEIVGWHLPLRGSATASVLIVHGNAGFALHRDYLAKPVHEGALVDVYVLEYPGYGARAGSPGMKSLLAAAEESFASLPTNKPVYVVSESLGTGVAAHLAKVYRERVSGLAMFAPYNNLASVGQRHMPFLPVRWILRERFNPAEWLKDYRGPVNVVIAGADEVIPADLGQELHETYAGPKRLQLIEGARHNGIAVQSSEWWKNAFLFWQQHAIVN